MLWRGLSRLGVVLEVPSWLGRVFGCPENSPGPFPRLFQVPRGVPGDFPRLFLVMPEIDGEQRNRALELRDAAQRMLWLLDRVLR